MPARSLGRAAWVTRPANGRAGGRPASGDRIRLHSVDHRAARDEVAMPNVMCTRAVFAEVRLLRSPPGPSLVATGTMRRCRPAVRFGSGPLRRRASPTRKVKSLQGLLCGPPQLTAGAKPAARFGWRMRMKFRWPWMTRQRHEEAIAKQAAFHGGQVQFIRMRLETQAREDRVIIDGIIARFVKVAACSHRDRGTPGYAIRVEIDQQMIRMYQSGPLDRRILDVVAEQIAGHVRHDMRTMNFSLLHEAEADYRAGATRSPWVNLNRLP